jgi:hypothetical protein
MLKRILFKSGVNRENTKYASEAYAAVGSPVEVVGAWYESDKVRFRSGTPEKIGGWTRLSASTFLGVCRSLWNWITVSAVNLVSVGTNLKFYIEKGGLYYDITPIRGTATLTNPFTATNGSSVLTVADTAHGCVTGDFVTFSGAGVAGLGGNVTATVLKAEYQVTVVDDNSYTITLPVTANATDASGSPGGGTVSAAYQINVGSAAAVPFTGWSAGSWGAGTWGVGGATTSTIRLWSQSNFGDDLVFAPRGGPMYYWAYSSGVTARAVPVTSLSGASEVPTIVNYITVSDTSRFVFALGCNELFDTDLDPMLVRWSDQEDITNWKPGEYTAAGGGIALSQAGSIRFSRGSELITAIQTRQELVIFSDTSVYSMQFVGFPEIWSSSILGDNISIASPNCAAIGSGIVFWMGLDKFYKYDGRVQTLRCDLRQHVFSNINIQQKAQIFCGTNEGFNEVWWFYCSEGSNTIDRYVVYNYLEDIWYYGTMARTAWLDSGLRPKPMAATYSNNIVYHEEGVDDNETGTATAINAYITSTEFDIEDGHKFGFVYRILPDLTFRGSSTGSNAECAISLIPSVNSGSGYNSPQSVAGSSSASIVRTTVVPETYTGQVYIRVRGRQMTFKIESNKLGTTWQLGAPRIDVRMDGRAA